MVFKKIRKRVYQILEVAKDNDKLSRVADISIMTLISLSVLATILESVPQLGQNYGKFFKFFEKTTLIAFSIEYILRIWSCKENKKFAKNLGRLRWALSFHALIDVIAILPGLLIISGIDFRFLRAVRLMRLFRLTRYNKSFILIIKVLATTKQALVVSLSGTLVILLVVSSLVYTIEHDANPEVFSSIPATMWWGVITLTTVGYGDTYPITPMGKFFASIVAFLGIGTFALPAGILAGAFNKALTNIAPELDPTEVANLDSIFVDDKNNEGTLVAKIIENAILDANRDSIEGIAIIEIDDTNGRWEFLKKNQPGQWHPIDFINSENSLLLPSDKLSRIRFVPNESFVGTAYITIRAWDQYTGTPYSLESTTINGENSSFSAQCAISTITVKKQ